VVAKMIRVLNPEKNTLLLARFMYRSVHRQYFPSA
jgi:hypothetical protein